MASSGKDYSNGKIYKILNTIDDSCYVGSTIQPLSKRMAWHRDAFVNPKVNHRQLYQKMSEYGIDNFYIELIEECPSENVEQLRKREGELIRQFGTLNKKIEGRSKSEYGKVYDATHREQRTERSKRFRERHHEAILERRRELRLVNGDKIREQDKIYYNQNKDKIYERTKEWKATKFDCPCGGSYNNSNKSTHMKTNRHQQYLNNA